MTKFESFIITAELVKETASAWLLDCEGDHNWFPKSQVKFDAGKKELDCPKWLLKEKFPKEDWS